MPEPSVMADGVGMGELSQGTWSREPAESLNGSEGLHNPFYTYGACKLLKHCVAQGQFEKAWLTQKL